MSTLKMKTIKYTEQAQARINATKIELGLQRRNLNLIVEDYKNARHIKAEPFKPRIINYNCLPKSEKHFQWEIQQCQSEITLLEKELDTLIKYGATYED